MSKYILFLIENTDEMLAMAALILVIWMFVTGRIVSVMTLKELISVIRKNDADDANE